MTPSVSVSSIKKQARDVLSRLYRVYYEETGQYLSPDEFFPVDLGKIISSVMSWEFEGVSDLGPDRYGQRLRGDCNHDEKRIRISVEGMKPGEKAFTIAHEIGHALMHKEMYRPSSSSSRKKRIRRVTALTETDYERKMEREADIFATEIVMPEKAVRDYFYRIFGRHSIWVGSAKARQVTSAFRVKSDAAVIASGDAEGLAPYFAEYRERPSISMREFFGVSRAAMSLRLRELKLIY
jgi:Zn-dependent peptidase ImmA (M78 family)